VRGSSMDTMSRASFTLMSRLALRVRRMRTTSRQYALAVCRWQDTEEGAGNRVVFWIVFNLKLATTLTPSPFPNTPHHRNPSPFPCASPPPTPTPPPPPRQYALAVCRRAQGRGREHINGRLSYTCVCSWQPP
jgi:hypothetical protein